MSISFPAAKAPVHLTPLSQLESAINTAFVNSTCKKFFTHLAEGKALSLHPEIEQFFIYKEQTVPELLDVDPSNAPEAIKPKQDVKLFSVKKQSSLWTGDLLNQIVVPTDLGLMMIAAYYGKKYSIEIVVCSNTASLEAALRGSHLDESCKSWGVIVTNGTDPNPHVTPLLCFRNKKGKIQVAELDSVCSPCLCYLETKFMLSASDDKNWEFLSVLEPRQVTFYGCRTDACIILKDALRKVHQESYDDLTQLLIIPEAYAAHNKFILPPSLCKSAQIHSKIPEAHLQVKLAGKRNETLQDFFQRHSHLFFRKENFHLTYTEASDPSTIKSDSITIIKERWLSTYSNIKAKSLLLHINRILNGPEVDWEIKLRLDVIRSLF